MWSEKNKPQGAEALCVSQGLQKLCVLFGLLFGWPAFLAYLGTEPDAFWRPHVAKAMTVVVLLVPTIDSVMQVIPASPPDWIKSEAPAPILSTVQASACVIALRDCVALLAGYARWIRGVATIGEGVCFHRSTCGMVIQRLNTRPWDVAYRSVQQCLDTGYRPCRDFGT